MDKDYEIGFEKSCSTTSTKSTWIHKSLLILKKIILEYFNINASGKK